MMSREPGGPSRPAALLAVRCGPADVGRRVTVRRLVEDGQLSDAVGVLLSWSPEGLLVVEKRSGEQVQMSAYDVVAAKVVAPELSADAMQKVAELGWPPAETGQLGDWVLRATHGVTGRANSVRVVGDPGMPLDAALDAVVAWYGERGLPPVLQLPQPSGYDEELDARGWLPARVTTMRTAGTPGLVDRAAALLPPDADRYVVELSADTDSELLAFVEPSLDPVVLASILTAPDERAFVRVRDASGALVAAGRASVSASPVGRWAGITSVATAEHARRRGLGGLVMASLGQWALDAGCPRTYLQVMSRNAGAIALYERLGFALHHAYAYRSPVAISDR
ncbi:MAG: GNAT family N-acetyltransferase [Actinobacteria bacterium]|jgi:GNAT superfamily N-acetyltransferase|nr:GNAT family N-acetyltransferase [Actinomycetota bacterium]